MKQRRSASDLSNSTKRYSDEIFDISEPNEPEQPARPASKFAAIRKNSGDNWQEDQRVFALPPKQEEEEPDQHDSSKGYQEGNTEISNIQDGLYTRNSHH